MIVSNIRIEERETGWYNHATKRLHKTAVHAFKAVSRNDQKFVKATGNSKATVITWEPTTRVGRMVVRAIAG
jgi:hypothetical protein